MSVASSAVLTTEPVNSEGIVAAGAYVDGRRVANIAISEASTWRSRPGHVVWIGLHEPDMALLTSVQRQFQLHDLATEDADHAHQRPKIEQYGDALFISKPSRLLDRQVGRSGTFQDPVCIAGGAAKEFRKVRAVGHQESRRARPPRSGKWSAPCWPAPAAPTRLRSLKNIEPPIIAPS